MPRDPILPEALVVSSSCDFVATITLNRPDKANALSRSMMDALDQAVRAACEDAGVLVIVLAAKGCIFCAGHDLEEMLAHEDRDWQQAHFERCSQMMLAIRNSTKPVIAKVQGAAVAAGCQLVATCDIAYAVDTAKFGVNGVNLGLFCATPSVALSRAIPERKALELALTGRLIKAEEALSLGLINAVLPADELDGAVEAVARTIAGKSPAAIALGKAAFWAQSGQDLETAYAMAASAMADNMDLDETRAGISAFVAKI